MVYLLSLVFVSYRLVTASISCRATCFCFEIKSRNLFGQNDHNLFRKAVGGRNNIFFFAEAKHPLPPVNTSRICLTPFKVRKWVHSAPEYSLEATVQELHCGGNVPSILFSAEVAQLIL